jgi:recombination protein RecR
MDAFTESMERLIACLGELPGIGRRTAERLAFYLLEADEKEISALRQALHDIKTKLGRCQECGGMAEGERCGICSSPRRDRTRVLGGLVAPVDGEGPERLDLERLVARVGGGEVQEVILALAPTAEGDGTALVVADRLKPLKVRLTRLARGLPTGATLEYTNPGMLADALRGRQAMGDEAP